jgi:hypothetical protein
MGIELDEVVVADPPEAWEAAGFTVDPDGVCRIGSVRVRLVGREVGKRIVGWSLRGLDEGTSELDGLATTASTAPAPEPAEHPNGAVELDHIVLLSPDIDRTIAAFGAVGLDVRRQREGDPAQYGFAAVQTFFKAGEPIVELIGGKEASGDGPTGFFGLAWTVSDIDALPGRYGPSGLGSVKDAVQPGRRIATLRHKEFGMSVATAFMTPEPT